MTYTSVAKILVDRDPEERALCAECLPLLEMMEQLCTILLKKRYRRGAVDFDLPEAALPGSTVVLPLIYGIGTALPVLLVAFLLAYSAQSVGRAYNVMAKVEWWARMTTGWLFIGLGIYFELKYVFEAF